nr:EIICBA-Mtl [Candidatus Pantoea persica]
MRRISGIITALFIPTGWIPNATLAKLVGPMISYLLPLTSIFVEPAKILFLNKPLATASSRRWVFSRLSEAGKSIFFLIEANPGSGMGVLVAYMMFGRGSARQSAGGAAIIHFLGGIHEIYFPYVLMAPRLLLAVILGGMTGVFPLTLLNGGLVSPASPDSILAVLAMTPKGAYFANISAIFAAFAVSFVVSSIC